MNDERKQPQRITDDEIEPLLGWETVKKSLDGRTLRAGLGGFGNSAWQVRRRIPAEKLGDTVKREPVPRHPQSRSPLAAQDEELIPDRLRTKRINRGRSRLKERVYGNQAERCE